MTCIGTNGNVLHVKIINDGTPIFDDRNNYQQINLRTEKGIIYAYKREITLFRKNGFDQVNKIAIFYFSRHPVTPGTISTDIDLSNYSAIQHISTDTGLIKLRICTCIKSRKIIYLKRPSRKVQFNEVVSVRKIYSSFQNSVDIQVDLDSSDMFYGKNTRKSIRSRLHIRSPNDPKSLRNQLSNNAKSSHGTTQKTSLINQLSSETTLFDLNIFWKFNQVQFRNIIKMKCNGGSRRNCQSQALILASTLDQILQELPNDKIRTLRELKLVFKKMIFMNNKKTEFLDKYTFINAQLDLINADGYAAAINSLSRRTWERGKTKKITYYRLHISELHDVLVYNGIIDQYFKCQAITNVIQIHFFSPK